MAVKLKRLRISRLILLISSLAALTMIGLGSIMIYLILTKTRVQTAEEQAKVLVKSLSASLQNDLLTSNLFVATDRARSFFSAETRKWTCFYVQSPAKLDRRLIQIGDPVVCDLQDVRRLREFIYFDSSQDNPAFVLTLQFAPLLMPMHFSAWTLVLPALVLLVALISVVMLTTVAQRLFTSINVLILTEGLSGSEFLGFPITELQNIQKILVELKEKRKQLIQSQIEGERTAALREVTSQVSHDIRSPLTALNMAISNLDGLSEDRRLLICRSAKRINDIANGLLESDKKSRFEPVPLDAIVAQISWEKQSEFLSRCNLKIELDSSNVFGTFVRIEPSELARVLSNLINNSVEARRGRDIVVQLGLAETKETAIITVKDNGKGIPSEIISKLGQRGLSRGKSDEQSGTGLGIYHGKKALAQAGGTLEYQSIEGVGTTATIRLPKIATPSWFVGNIEIQPNSIVVSVDDDESVHQVWAQRLSRAGKNYPHLPFTELKVFREWYRTNSKLPAHFLIDFEFTGQDSNGLAIIAELGIGSSAVLVTSRYEEREIQETALRLGVRILPKSLVNLVPIRSP
jgi:signal transduction histidine kinase